MRGLVLPLLWATRKVPRRSLPASSCYNPTVRTLQRALAPWLSSAVHGPIGSSGTRSMTWNDEDRPAVPPPLPAAAYEQYDTGPDETYDTADASTGANWPLARRNRLETEWRRLQRAF